MNSARIDFVPYQFRPALKLIKSDEPRILIADSVGVGKTIEAGLIIKELEARNELENIMIICPKPLVTERKWELEMKRFDEDFIPLDGATLRQILSDTDRDGEWPSRYNKTIVPYSILDNRVYSGEGGMKSKNYDFEPVAGTRLTLFVAPELSYRIYRSFVNEYCKRDALFNKNPLLFLNKLTELRLYIDGFRSLKFSVSRNTS